MDRMRFSTIAHGDHVFCNPIGEERVDRVLDLLALDSGDRVIDVGCGKAEMLIRLVERRGVRAVGVDLNGEYLREARRRAAQRSIPDEHLELHEADARTVPLTPGSFGAALCIGSTHAFVDYGKAVRALGRLVRPGGRVLLGEGFWRREPEPEYLAALGARRDEFRDHAGNVALGAEAGLVPLYASVSNDDEWDHYEGLYCRAVERFAFEHPDDPDRDEMQRSIRKWRDMYLRWGRTTLGFAMYIFMRPRD
jgi:ubiquinone/menaquinone biosynthesis C-methylase UbiE